MGFLNRLRDNIRDKGASMKNALHQLPAYAKAFGRVIYNNPEYLGQIGGIVGGGIAYGSSAYATGGASVATPAGMAAGAGLVGAAKKTFGEIKEKVKKEVKKPTKVKFDPRKVQELKEEAAKGLQEVQKGRGKGK